MATGARAGAGPSLPFVGVLVLATALGPFAMQIFLPALPAIQEEFAVSAVTAQLAFSLSTFAIAVAMLLYGPLSDRVGRRPALIGGILVYLAGSLLCAVAGSILLLILGRIVQAAGGCAGLVLSRAIVRDLYAREQAATVLAYITMAMVVAPMIAPALGGALTDLVGWRLIFVVGAVIGLGLLLAVQAVLAETAPPAKPATAPGAGGRGGGGSGFLALLRSTAFLAFALQGAFSIAVFYAFMASAPYLMVKVLGRPASEYGLMFLPISAAFMLGNLVAARWSPRVGSERMILWGSLGSFLAVLGVLLSVSLDLWSAWSLVVPMSLGAIGQGMSLPNTQAAMVSVDPQAAGTASGLGGFLQMGLAALAAQLVGSLQYGSAYPMALAMTFCAGAALVAALVAARTSRRLRRGPPRQG